VRAVVFGDREMGCVCLEELLRLGVEVPLVVTDPPDPAEAPGFRRLAEFAPARGVETAVLPDAKGPGLPDRVRAAAPDAVLSFAYRHRIPGAVLALPRLGAFNLHESLLPRWRGPTPIPSVILSGEETSGVTLHHMTADLDAGDVVGRETVPVERRETATTLYRKTAAAARTLLARCVPLVAEGRAPRTPLDLSRATTTAPIGAQRELDLRWSVLRFDRTVRAFTRPYPGARIPFGLASVVIWSGEPGEGAVGVPLRLANGVYRAFTLGFEGQPARDASRFLEAHPDAAALLGRREGTVPPGGG
jgi:methionyl-tRNA formyltransferase